MRHAGVQRRSEAPKRGTTVRHWKRGIATHVTLARTSRVERAASAAASAGGGAAAAAVVTVQRKVT